MAGRFRDSVLKMQGEDKPSEEIKFDRAKVDLEKIRALGFEVTGRRYDWFLSSSVTPTAEQISGLLSLLTLKEHLVFWNFYRESGSDPGSYISAYARDGKAILMESNHGWSSGYYNVSLSDLTELIIRNWDKDWDKMEYYKNAIAIRKTFDPDEMTRWMEKASLTYVPDYEKRAW